MPPVLATARRVPSIVPCIRSSSITRAIKQDVVVLADSDQDHKQEETDSPIEAAPRVGAAMKRMKHQVGQPERCQIAEHDSGDQVKADAGPAEQEDQNRINAERDQYIHSVFVGRGHAFQVVHHRRRARDPDRRRSLPAAVRELPLPARRR